METPDDPPVFMEFSPGKVSRADLETLPAGLYEIDEPHRRLKAYDPALDCWVEAIVRTAVRICNGKRLPSGVDQAYFRADGKRVVIGDDLVERLERFDTIDHA
jgi:hypothetical protein